jgi:hypothetical protein
MQNDDDGQMTCVLNLTCICISLSLSLSLSLSHTHTHTHTLALTPRAGRRLVRVRLLRRVGLHRHAGRAGHLLLDKDARLICL